MFVDLYWKFESRGKSNCEAKAPVGGIEIISSMGLCWRSTADVDNFRLMDGIHDDVIKSLSDFFDHGSIGSLLKQQLSQLVEQYTCSSDSSTLFANSLP